MAHDKISLGQLLTLLFAALLSPMIQILPRESVLAAGRAGWMTTLAVLPAALLLCWALHTVPGRLGEGAGLAQGLEAAFGRNVGRLLVAAYLVWGVLLLGWSARWCAYRVLSVNYRNAPLPLFILALLALTAWAGRKKLSSFARAGEIFALALGTALTLALVLALFRTKWKNLGPIWAEDLPGVVRGTLPVLSLFGYGVPAAFLAGQVSRRPGAGKRLYRWAVGMCLALTVFQVICISTFGPGLIEEMETPFFMMLRVVGVPGAFERVESLIMSLWLFSDLALLGLLFFSCRTMARHLLGGKPRPWIPVVLIAAAGGLALASIPDLFHLSWVMERGMAAANIIFGIAIPVLAAAAAKLRRKI